MGTSRAGSMSRITGTTVVAMLVLALTALSLVADAEPESEAAAGPVTALLIIDVQEFYFPGGFLPLDNPEAASLNSKKIIEKFRSEKKLVIHVGHNTKKDNAFHPDVAPIDGEQVFHKDEVSAFNGTGLLEYLRDNGVEKLVVCGMMTHMCVEAAVRAAYDLGFECALVGDACATRDLDYGEDKVKAADVHASTLGTLDGSYATVVDTKTFLETWRLTRGGNNCILKAASQPPHPGPRLENKPHVLHREDPQCSRV
jgi:nicotinamidase-related amidase